MLSNIIKEREKLFLKGTDYLINIKLQSLFSKLERRPLFGDVNKLLKN